MIQTYTHQVTKSIALNTKLTNEDARKFIGSIYWNYLFNHGAMNYTDSKGNSFPKETILKKGDVFKTNQPQLEGNNFSVYEVIACDMESEDTKFICVQLKVPSSKTPFKSSQLTITYKNNDVEKNNQASITYFFQCSPNHSSIMQLTEMNCEVMLKRAKRLSDDPLYAMKELELISNLSFNYSPDSKLSGFSNGITTQLKIGGATDTINAAINRYQFLCKLFSNTIKDNTIDPNSKINQLSNFNIRMSSLSWGMSQTQVEVSYNLQMTQKGLIIKSESGVDYFGKIAYEISFLGDSNNHASLQVGIYYDKSTTVNIADKIKKASNFFTTSVPDPMLFMMFRARGMLDTCIRHLIEYMRSELGYEASPIESSQAISRSFNKI